MRNPTRSKQLILAQEHSCPLMRQEDINKTCSFSTILVPRHKQPVIKAISSWWGQLARFGMRSNMMFYQSEFNRGTRSVLNWAKMAWWNSRYVGCAVKNCGSFYAVSCMYYPGGANVNQYVYQVGAVCSGCPPGQCDGQALCRWE
ncbi:hypothetical protein ANCCAN_06836 [Ancylostoma caninum]|uniref:SCP domain-containing protein n=1 Tax=Ancylostoma caninum TaxID=29170 RepID=A0A368GRV7_ANCCA|nr:hypothetical protein ANCCAN_06836 [Ancylostoma caninum]